jgi:hypothetical protein
LGLSRGWKMRWLGSASGVFVLVYLCLRLAGCKRRRGSERDTRRGRVIGTGGTRRVRERQ